MNAKEYLKHQWGINDMDMFSDIFTGIDMVLFAKEYHLAKSKEDIPYLEHMNRLIDGLLANEHDHSNTEGLSVMIKDWLDELKAASGKGGEVKKCPLCGGDKVINLGPDVGKCKSCGLTWTFNPSK